MLALSDVGAWHPETPPALLQILAAHGPNVLGALKGSRQAFIERAECGRSRVARGPGARLRMLVFCPFLPVQSLSSALLAIQYGVAPGSRDAGLKLRRRAIHDRVLSASPFGRTSVPPSTVGARTRRVNAVRLSAEVRQSRAAAFARWIEEPQHRPRDRVRQTLYALAFVPRSHSGRSCL